METRSILIIGNYGAGNLGDDAILGGIVRELRNAGYQGEIQVSHGGKRSSPEIYKGLKHVPFMPVGLRSRLRNLGKKNAFIEALKRADQVILGGGGLFVDTESWKAPFIWASHAKICQKYKKPYLCFGQSIGPLKHPLSRYWAKQTFKKAKSIHVRDENSAQYLEQWGLKASVGIDPAFSWLLHEKRPIPKKPVLLVSLRKWPHLPDYQPLLKEIQVFAKRKKWKIILLSTDLKEKKEDFASTGAWEWYQPQSAREAFEACEKAQKVCSMRLHAGIFSIAGGTPTIALSYSEKVKAQLKNLCTVLEDFTPALLREALKKTEKNPQSNVEKKLIANQDFLKNNLI